MTSFELSNQQQQQLTLLMNLLNLVETFSNKTLNLLASFLFSWKNVSALSVNLPSQFQKIQTSTHISQTLNATGENSSLANANSSSFHDSPHAQRFKDFVHGNALQRGPISGSEEEEKQEVTPPTAQPGAPLPAELHPLMLHQVAVSGVDCNLALS